MKLLTTALRFTGFAVDEAASGLDAIAKAVPELIGGAADLTSSTRTIFKDSGNFHLDPAGRNIFFGVREFGMCAAVNGMAVHGGLIPYGSTPLSR